MQNINEIIQKTINQMLGSFSKYTNQTREEGTVIMTAQDLTDEIREHITKALQTQQESFNIAKDINNFLNKVKVDEMYTHNQVGDILSHQQDSFEKMIGEDRKNDGSGYESTKTNVENFGYNQAKQEIRQKLKEDYKSNE